MTHSISSKEFRYIGRKSRSVEDRRFISGQAIFAGDIKRPGQKHVSVVASPYPAAKITNIDLSQARKQPGVIDIITGEQLVAATNQLATAVDTPNVKRWPLAVGQVRYTGEWVVAIVAESRAQAEDAAELVEIDYDPLDHVVDPERALETESPLVHPDHGSNVLLDRSFTWGDVDQDFKLADYRLSYRVKWGRSSTVPLETFAVTASWDSGTSVMDIWASIQMPKYADQIARALRLSASSIRVHYDVDVGGSYGVKRGLKQTVLVAELSRRIGKPVTFIEDRLQNMSGGDAHGPDRIFDVDLAYNNDGLMKSIRIRALDNAGAYAGRSPFQLGKPVGAIVGPYMIKSAAYHAQSVTTNITPQEAVRGFGQAPTNYAIEHGVDLVARALNMDRLELRRKNLIPSDAFPYKIPSGSTYDSGNFHGMLDKLMDTAGGWQEMLARRDALRGDGFLAGLGLSCCLEPSGGNSSFEPLLNPKNDTTTWMESCQLQVDALGGVIATISTTSSGQGHETLTSLAIAEILQLPPNIIRVARATSLTGHASNSPVGSRMAIMLGGAAAGAAEKIRGKFLEVAAFNMGVAVDDLLWRDGGAEVRKSPERRLDWDQLVHICHRNAHRLPPDMEPGISVVYTMQVPTGGALPDADGRIQMYPCYSFESHLVLVKMDPVICKPEIIDYHLGHDCGVVINPDIVRGMTLGGVAHGIGAALMERFEVDSAGQLKTVTFMDYPMPSSHELPAVNIVNQITPSPLTCFGQKGSGESGYLGSPAAIANAVNDALAPLNLTFSELPMRMSDISDLVASGNSKGKIHDN